MNDPRPPGEASGFRPYHEYRRLDPEQMADAARAVCERLNRRRSVRAFSSEAVPRAVIESCLLAASSAPSGANQQPWQFVAISDPQVKSQIRKAAEAEEQRFYGDRASQAWLDDLAPLGTDAHKPFLEDAPWLIAIFSEKWHFEQGDEKKKHYYVTESVGIATGMLIAALHEAGLATLTHTPSPMGFLREVLGRGAQERPFLLLVVGYPEPEVQVPDIARKTLPQIATFI
ncbi:MAG: nitroreductase family protein [Pseudomonadota bacterium]